MSVRVVCISRTLGAGGEGIGRTVAERLGFRYVDEEVIAAAAEKARVDPTLIADVEHRQSMLTRLMESLSVVPRARSSSAAHPAGAAAPPSSERAARRAVIREAIAEIAAEGRAVIVAHAASLMLAGSPDTLRVLVTASPTKRGERLDLPAGPDIARRAAEAIDASDRERRDYLREFYGVREELPTHYDLVINTDALSADQATAIILHLATAPASS